MKLTREQKKLLFQQVHCTNYLKAKRSQYRLNQNEQDGCWYYENRKAPDAEPIKANPDENTWKHNIRYEIKDCTFTGVVVKVWETVFSTSLGISGTHQQAFPCKRNDCFIPVATVCCSNGCKRIVPLECIQEYIGFTDGKFIRNLNSFFISLNFEEPITK